MSGFGQSRAKAERLVLVTAALGRGRPLSLNDLRNDHGLYADGTAESTRRQFERDKVTLRESGVLIETIEHDESPKYWIRSNRRTVRLEDHELDALAVLASVVGDPNTGVSLATFAGEAGQFPSDASPGKVSVDNLTIVPEITTALADGRQLEIDYRDAEGDKTTRTIEPWELRHRNGLTYVVAWDLLREERRSFRIDRIDGTPVLGDLAQSQRPDGPTGPVHPDQRSDFTVTVPVALRQAVTDLGGKVVTDTEDLGGSVVAQFDAMRPETMLGWSLRHGATITSPDVIADEQRARLARLVARHEGKPPKVAKPKRTRSATGPLSVERMRRLMLLPRFLGELKGVTHEELAGYLGCSLDELTEELALLDGVELPGYGMVGEVEDRNGQIVYHRHLHDPTIHLSPADALRLLFLVEMVRPILSEQTEGIEAISQRLHEMIPAVVQIDLAGMRHPDLDVIKSAIASGENISFEYQGRKDVSRRVRYITAGQFRIANGAVYVAGSDLTNGNERQFRLDRMGHVTVNVEVPATTDQPAPKKPAKREAEVEVVLHLGRRATWLLAQLSPAGVTDLDDGTTVALVPTDASDWLASHVLAAGGEAEVISPTDLRERVAVRAAEALAR